MSGCATKIKSIKTEYAKIEATITNPHREAYYNLFEASGEQISSCHPDENGNLVFDIDDLTLYDPENYYLYITDGNEQIKFSNDNWKFKNPVWDKYYAVYEPIIEVQGEIYETQAALVDKKDGLQQSTIWLQQSKEYASSACQLPDSRKVAGFVSNVAGDMAGSSAGAAAGAAVGSVVPVVGTAIGGLVGGFIGGIIGSKVAEKVINGNAEARVQQCDIIVKYMQDCSQQIPILENQYNTLHVKLNSETENLQQNLEHIKSMSAIVNESSAF